MNEKELAEMLKYSNPYELYVIAWNNVLKLLFCPFKVAVNHDIGNLKKSQIVWVEEVKVTINLVAVYKIQGLAYYYYHFEIIIDDG